VNSLILNLSEGAMKVEYIKSTGEIPEDMKKLGYSPNVELHLSYKTEYKVYGITSWIDVILYLIYPDREDLPSWHPACLFSIIDSSIPFDWYFRYFENNSDHSVKFIIGYKELALDTKHYDGLIDRNRDEIKVFLNRKREMDEFF
jgi:hypothetical protein